MSVRTLCAAGFLFVVTVAGVLFLTQSHTKYMLLARVIVTWCAYDNSFEKVRCYEEYVTKLYPRLSVSDIFSVVRSVRVFDSSYINCHPLAHKIARMVVSEDPRSWQEVLHYNPDDVCSNGFLHEAISSRFKGVKPTESEIAALLPRVTDACSLPNSRYRSLFDRALCYHGLGHLFLFLTEARVDDALALCDVVADPPMLLYRSCIRGVFMQIFQPVEQEDHDLLQVLAPLPTRETYRDFCAKFSNSEHEGVCLREAWVLYEEEVLYKGGTMSFCRRQPDNEQKMLCERALMRLIGRYVHPDSSIVKECLKFDVFSKRVDCISLAAEVKLIEDRSAHKKAIAFCRARGEEYAFLCEQSLAERTGDIYGISEEGSKLCAAFLPTLREACESSRGKAEAQQEEEG